MEGGFTQKEIGRIIETLEIFKKKTCIEFEPYTGSEGGYVVFNVSTKIDMYI